MVDAYDVPWKRGVLQFPGGRLAQRKVKMDACMRAMREVAECRFKASGFEQPKEGSQCTRESLVRRELLDAGELRGERGGARGKRGEMCHMLRL